MKKSIAFLIAACGIALAGCSTNTNKTESSSSSSSSSVSRSSSVKPDPNASERTWTYKNNIFDAGNETYRFTKWDVMDSVDEGKKVLVLYCDVTNNSTKEMDPSNVYMVVHAYQKNATSDVQLDPGMVKPDENGNDPLQQYEDGLHNNLLPGKTVKAVMLFTINNDRPVRLEFENPNFETIGTKTYKVSKKLSKADRKKLNQSNSSSSSTTQTNTVSQTKTAAQQSEQTTAQSTQQETQTNTAKSQGEINRERGYDPNGAPLLPGQDHAAGSNPDGSPDAWVQGQIDWAKQNGYLNSDGTETDKGRAADQEVEQNEQSW
ncbi:DUF5067 domain-containing protein [Limosilactobacillus mucosae]|uniref:DUF5067 domain-containing protein n=1 Tax=Limosilactobacillus mucosae TaxID=97478 RepID=UPI0025A419BD|nr:DUF5067 domain-containing protein [Limosilactobacillus mucosae]MDM8220011.1 DUF5067 domain-containing protein [Limosilactobacillus mucosae]MDM8314667.1 DUF5067 domain-containing protein [Limosilactobacillus mucosae]